MRLRGLLLFTAFSAASLALLIGLGVWQLQRLEWKQGLIAQIEARAHAEPVTLKEAVTRAKTGEDVSYLRVRVEGRFDNGKERYLYAVSDGTPGWHVITPLETPEGEVVLVDRGFVPDAFKEPSSRAQGEINDAVSVTGLARTPRCRGASFPTMSLPKTAGSGATLAPCRNRCFPPAPRTLRRSFLRPSGAIFPAAGRLVARPGSIFPTTICNMR